MSTHTVVLIPGDGIGPDITEAVPPRPRGRRRRHPVDRAAGRRGGARPTATTCCPTPRWRRSASTRWPSRGRAPRRSARGSRRSTCSCASKLNLYAAVRPVRSLPGVPTRFEDVDLVIIRENTEGLYSGVENEVTPGRGDEHEGGHRDRLPADRPLGVPLRHPAPAQEDHGLPQGQHHEDHRRPVPPLRRGRSTSSEYPEHRVRGGDHRRRLHEAGAGSRRSSTCCCWRTSTATWSATCAPAWSAGWASCPARTSATARRSSRRCTARPRTSPARASPIRWPC